MASPFQKEHDTYEALEADLLRRAEGQWVLIKGDQLLGIFGSRRDAVREGFRRLGRQDFYTEQILVERPIYYCPHFLTEAGP